MGPGKQQLYEGFGHSAFHVSDRQNGIDWVYNYGTFDFNQPNFYMNFTRGYLLYKLAKQDYQRFRDAYAYFNRAIQEQVLNLSQPQKQKLFEFLENNARPENSNYLYDYFYDNCATKLRDVLEEVFPDSIRFDDSHITTDYTIRQLVDIYIEDKFPWGDFGIDLALGLPMDKTASPYEYMFLPDYIHSAFANASIKTDSGELPLVARALHIYESRPEIEERVFFTPEIAFWLLLVLVLISCWWEIRSRKYLKIFDVVFFSTLGLLGSFLVFLWVGTDHASSSNYNLLWAIPLHLPMIILFMLKKYPDLLRRYFLTTCIMMVLVLAFWVVLPQQLHYSLVPFLLAISARAFMVYRAV